KTETERRRTDQHLHDVHGKHHRYGIKKTSEKSLQSFFVNTGVFNKKHTHHCKGKRDVQILRRRFHAKELGNGGQSYIDDNRHHIRERAISVFSEDPPEKSAEKIDARFQKELLLTRVLHLQIPYQDQRK